ncbi:hypothetical protein [Micromonospora lupini]|uniref:hypothetical protein n=1 Tax=Micromonospora lupini TaxID=285679 RepID=UPI0033D58020
MSTPQPQRRSELFNGANGIAARCDLSSIEDHARELVKVNLAFADRESVADAVGVQQVRRRDAECAADLEDGSLDLLPCRRWGITVPEKVGEFVDDDRSPGLQQQASQQQLAAGAAHRQRASLDPHVERSENTEVHWLTP